MSARPIAMLFGGLRRMVGAPGLWLGSFVALTVLAMSTGAMVRTVVASAAMPFVALDPGHLVFGLVNMLDVHRAAGAAVLVAILVSGLLAAAGWMLLSPVIIARLAIAPGSGSGPDARGRLAPSLRHLPAIIVQSLWHLILRAVVVVALLLSVQPLPALVAWPLLAVVWVGCGVALDVARVSVVEHDAAPYKFGTAWRGLVHTARRPSLWLGCGLLSLLQLALTTIILYWGLATLGEGSTWLPRLVALLSVGLGLWRVGAVIEALDDDAP